MPVHVLCLIDALAPPGTMVGRTAALIRQRLQRYGCQLIVLESFKQFPAATRCSPFSLPVETLTAPRIRGQTAPGKRIFLINFNFIGRNFSSRGQYHAWRCGRLLWRAYHTAFCPCKGPAPFLRART